MTRFLFLLMLISTPAFAGISVCHTGETVTQTALRGNALQGCEYITENDNYEAVRTLIKTVPRKYLKWTTTLEEMTQAEKDAVDQAIADAQAAAQLSNARNGAETSVDELSPEGVRLRAALLVILDEFNILRQNANAQKACVDNANNLADIKTCYGAIANLPDRVASQIKTAIKNKITAGEADS